MFGISGSEAVVLLVIAVLVVGPERLPHYAAELARMIKELRRLAAGASAQVRQELGPEFDEVEWRKLDPRQYDPRRIVREALADSIDLDDPLGLQDLPEPRPGAWAPGKGRTDGSDPRGGPDPVQTGSTGSTAAGKAAAGADEPAGAGPDRGDGPPATRPAFDADAT
ncbi:MAG: sec-independent protein translocase protein TatB [Actinomycetota bacterium]|nr:sec-independent protein translocase protein TatB [Actinomycetota bacterium]